MKKLLYSLLLLPLAIFSLDSCQPLPEGYGIENPEQYSKVYIAASYGGHREYEVTPPAVDTISVYANYSGILPLKQDVTVNFLADASLVSAYNSANGTSFKALPQSHYTFDPSWTVIGAGTTMSKNPALIFIKTTAFQDDGKYLLPVKISSLSDSSLKVNDSMSTVYIGIHCTASAMYVTFNPLSDFIVDANQNW